MTYCAIRPGPYDAGAYITASNNLHTLHTGYNAGCGAKRRGDDI